MPSAVQVAYGELVEFDHTPVPDGTCVLMDWRGIDRADPSFGYVLSHGDGLFVQETSLARRPALPVAVLRARLDERLARYGGRVVRRREHEVVRIPMDLAVPDRDQRIVGLGAAAALVHPATGYSFAATLRSAPRVALALVAGLDRGGPVMASHDAWTALWSDARIHARALEQFGLERVLHMDQRAVRAFFAAFFRLEPAARATYMSGEATRAEIAGVMGSLFWHAPPRTKLRLASANPAALWRARQRST